MSAHDSSSCHSCAICSASSAAAAARENSHSVILVTAPYCAYGTHYPLVRYLLSVPDGAPWDMVQQWPVLSSVTCSSMPDTGTPPGLLQMFTYKLLGDEDHVHPDLQEVTHTILADDSEHVLAERTCVCQVCYEG